MPCQLHIAGVRTNGIEGINYRKVHFAALPNKVRRIRKSLCFSRVLPNEVIPSRLTIFVRIESIGFICYEIVFLLPLISHSNVITVQQGVESNGIPHIRRNSVAIFRRDSLDTDKGLSRFRRGCVLFRFVRIRQNNILTACRIILDRVGRRVMRQVNDIRNGRRRLRSLSRLVYGFGIVSVGLVHGFNRIHFARSRGLCSIFGNSSAIREFVRKRYGVSCEHRKQHTGRQCNRGHFLCNFVHNACVLSVQ